MSRRGVMRTLSELPLIKGFRPLWLRTNYRQAVILRLEEYEAFRLVDYEGMTHEQVAEQMNVSRPTVTRIYDEARKKLARALVEGRTFIIEGGNVEVIGEHYQCDNCNERFVVDTDVRGQVFCPECDSDRLTNLSECFVRGCGRCRRCK
ncbi:MAG: DUF134 domain-containing protein [Candidatus Cloacimonas sp.]